MQHTSSLKNCIKLMIDTLLRNVGMQWENINSPLVSNPT